MTPPFSAGTRVGAQHIGKDILRRPIRAALIHYRDSAAIGGSLRVGELLGKFLTEVNVEPHFIFAYGDRGPIARGSAAPCHFINAKGPGDYRAWLRMRRLIHDLGPDVLHFVNPVVWASVALSGTPYPKVLHVHGPMAPSTARFRDRCIWRWFRQVMSAHICVSQNMEQKLLAAGWGTPNHVFTVYNAVDCDHWARRIDSVDARKRLGLPQNKVLLGMVCRLVPAKGCDDAIRLLERLPERYHLAIAGDGPERPRLQQMADAKHLSGRLHMVGLIDDPRLAYSAMDALLFMSRTEPFGLLLAEAMASGVPIVGLAGEGGYREASYPLVTPDTAMLLDRPDSLDIHAAAPEGLLDRLATAIQELQASPYRREVLLTRAQSWVRTRFDGSYFALRVSEVYGQLLTRWEISR